ncbi:MAG: GSCFA domain-containing protein [Bacteroidetes bacterium]|nr:GSCFA domain-containing protein [Bacteroidota bacterium]
MIFRTEIRPTPSAFQISHAQRGLTIGSCFSDSIGECLEHSKFPIMRNPLGVVYNPLSIFTALQILCGKKTVTEQDLFNDKGIWKSYLLHSSFASTDKNEVLERCAEVQNRFSRHCERLLSGVEAQTLDYCIITLGTAWVYELIATGEVVNNCHKTPAKLFHRKQLSVAEIETALLQSVELLQSINLNVQIIFTISPVRHWNDGAHENQVSKSLLFVALDEILNTTKNTHYFESYELLMDDLRDYRFYENDLLHPNSQAIEYIWQAFSKTYFSAETQKIIQQIQALHKAMQHRPFQRTSSEYVAFCAKQLELCELLGRKFPYIDLREERAFFALSQKI